MQGLELHRRRWLPAVVWASVMLIVSSIPKLGIQQGLFPGFDKLAHLIEYFIFGVTLRYWSQTRRRPYLYGGIILGLLDELHQAYIPGRESSFWDFAADAAGVTFGYLIIRKWEA